MPATSASARPCAISSTASSNSPVVTKSTAGAAASVSAGSTMACAPTKPIVAFGFAAFSASAVFASDASDGVEVCTTMSSNSPARATTSSQVRSAGGASISTLSGISAAACASHVGYQNERISRRAW